MSRGWVSAARMDAGAASATHKSAASDTPWARTAASTPSAIRSPSRLISRSTANATGTISTATLEVSPARLISSGGAAFAPVPMSRARPWVVPWAKVASPRTRAIPAMPVSYTHL